MSDDDLIARCSDMLEKIEPVLVGQGPEAQGTVLATLTAMWVCGFHPREARREVMQAQFKAIRGMVATMSENRMIRRP